MQIKAGGRVIIALAVVGIIGFAANWAWDNGYFTPKKTIEASVPTRIDVPTASSAPVTQSTSATQVALTPAAGGYTFRVLTIPWNATMGLHYANGGPMTAPDSLMAKRGVSAKIERQDDYSQMISEQVAFAKQVANGVANPTEGAAFVVIMGDGYPAYVAGAQEAMSKLGQAIEVVGFLGYSRGEDKCIIDASSPVKGSLIAGVLGDGDINICIKYAADNGVLVNSDVTTYNPDAMNFVKVSSFVDADDKFITRAKEERVNTKTGKKELVAVTGTATWTPGDVKVADRVPNIRVLASTKEYAWQMPAVLIGNKQWMQQHKGVVENFLAAAFEGGELVRSNDQALLQAATTAAKVYNEEKPEYWAKYFKGVTEVKNGQQISLGGSTTNSLADNAYLFGLNGNDNLYKRVYNVFGGIAVKYFPDTIPKMVPYESVVNPTYVQSLLSKTKTMTAAATPTYSATAPTTGTFAKKSYAIEFETGKASFTPKAVETLDELLNQASISNLTVQLNGHTDNVGDPTSNMELSKRRADAVKAWLVSNAGTTFPTDRIRTRGYGDTTPVADNRTADGRAKNRRVDVLLLTN